MCNNQMQKDGGWESRNIVRKIAQYSPVIQACRRLLGKPLSSQHSQLWLASPGATMSFHP